jgi:hypothetical protein
MRRLAALAVVAFVACGPKPATTKPDDPDPELQLKPPPAAHDSRTPLEQRRDAACDALGPKITQCALEDSKTAAQNGEITQKQLSEISEPAVLKKNTEEFVKKCEAPMSSRQVRVLEVCGKAETECAPLLGCLAHLNDPGK